MHLSSLPLLLALSLAAPLPVTPPAPAAGKVFLTLEEALELAFPKAEVERTRAFLSEEEERRVAELADRDYEGRVVVPYVARKEGKVVGTAYFDTHEVRTKRETLMVVVDPEGKVRRIELLAFGEPTDYIPVAAWYGQFPGRRLDDQLELQRGIRGVSGATMTAEATTSAVRSVLALHQVLTEREDRAR